MERLNAKELQTQTGVGVRVECLEQVDSTNLYLKDLASRGAPHGTVVTAEEQTMGRGRQGRSFHSPAGWGLYLSALLRPDATPEQATDLTAWVAVAAARAVEAACGLRPDIKWVNDLQVEGKKLCGILCEMGLAGSKLDYVVAGIGINVSQRTEDFPPELRGLATSLALQLSTPPTRTALAQALIRELDRLCQNFPNGAIAYLEEYRARCVTLGRPVTIHRGGEDTPGFARSMDERFRLVVELPGGRVETLSAGEVSVGLVDKG